MNRWSLSKYRSRLVPSPKTGAQFHAELTDACAANELHRLWTANRRLYGRRKLWKAARRVGISIGRDQVKLMKLTGIDGIRREVIEHERPTWTGWRQVELATASWVHWYNHERLHSSIGTMPPGEFEELNYALTEGADEPVAA